MIYQSIRILHYNLNIMNIKCVTYSRYSTSVPIFTVNQEPNNKSIAADAEKVTFIYILDGLQD